MFMIAQLAVDQAGASQRVTELAAALEFVVSVQPVVIVEIGCDTGGTLYAWRQVCDAVYGITLAGNTVPAGGTGRPLVPHGAVVHAGDSHDLLSLDWLTGQLAGRLVDVLVLDGDHRPAGVLLDLAMYGPLVRPGGLILLHDIAVTTDPRSQVWRVWPALKRRYQVSEVAAVSEGFGWGVIHVRPGDRFDMAEPKGEHADG